MFKIISELRLICQLGDYSVVVGLSSSDRPPDNLLTPLYLGAVLEGESSLHLSLAALRVEG